MSDQAQDALRATIEAQAERIVRLERQLDAKAAALEVTTQELADLKAGVRDVPQPWKGPRLTWRQRLRKAIILAGGRLLPGFAKRAVKRLWDPWKVPHRVQPTPAAMVSTKRIDRTATCDIVCFSIIDWSFRWQRPQQLLSQFADAGHRVFVFKTSAFLVVGKDSYEIEPLRENVWEVKIAPPVMIDVYAGGIAAETISWFPSMLRDLCRDLDIVCAISLVQVATWQEVARDARRLFGWKVVYDCMDEWNSFPGMKPELLEAEERLVEEADLVTVSGKRLLEKWQGRSRRIELVRNAADFAHYAAPLTERLLEEVPGPVIGFFGAVAPWFDVGLLAEVAAARPAFSFVVVGGVFDVDVTPLEKLPNVHLLGQQEYGRMPGYLHAFDVCMIPFVVNEITAATDPVKFYEYISLGKPVVTTYMPELEPFRELLYFADDAVDFADKIDVAVAERDEGLRARRVEAARANTWPARATTMLGAIREVHPRVSIVIVSYNNRDLTRLCLESVLENSLYPNLEVLVVDNASTDGSVEMLREWRDDRVQFLFSNANIGFAAANNLGLGRAAGEMLVLLNNDTVVPRGWLPRMLRHLQDPMVGLVVAVTNFSGNESRIEVPYKTIEEMHPFAEKYMCDHEEQCFDIRVAAMYCIGLRRDVYDRVGALDEAFEVGMFEDDDYSHRTRLAGFRVVCAEDVFVHHFGQASFSKLAPAIYDAIWKRNQAHFEKKWGVRWEPHQPR